MHLDSLRDAPVGLPPIAVHRRSAFGTAARSLALACGLLAARAEATEYSDGVFPDSAWTATKIIDTTPSSAATFTAVQVAAGGNPAEYRSTSHTFGLGLIAVAHFESSSIWSPPPGAASIASISVSYDLVHWTGPALGAVRYKLALLQGGSIYEGPFDDIFSSSWTSFSHAGLVAAQFTRVTGGGPLLPDFGCNALPIQFGYLTSNSQGGAAPITKVSGIDNWTVTIEKDPCGETGAVGCCGDGSTLTACPCGNVGATCNGCANSVNGLGANLAATGIPASEFFPGTGPDTVQLTATGMPNTATSILIQGSAFLANRPVFGDGLRCCGGTLLRIDVQMGLGGTTTFGHPTQKISVAGAMPPGNQACYQVYYRDPSPTFCTTATFNVTNSIVIDWL